MLALLPLLLLGACKDKGAGDSDSVPAGTCDITIDKTYPTDGSTDFYVGDYVEITLSDSDSTASVSADFDGSSSVSSDGTVITYTPNADLAGNTDYTVTVSYCGGDKTAEIHFHTRDMGPTSSSLAGNAYALDLAAANIVEPAGVGSALGALLSDPIILGVTAEDGGNLSMAIVASGTCADLPSADFSNNPFFQVGPGDASITVSDATITIKGLEVTGAFTSDGSAIVGGTLAGQVDARDIAAAIPSLGQDADGLCGMLGQFGAACGPCSDGATYCLSIVANRINANKDPAGFTCQ